MQLGFPPLRKSKKIKAEENIKEKSQKTAVSGFDFGGKSNAPQRCSGRIARTDAFLEPVLYFRQVRFVRLQG
jgi:hypothetical protein